MRIKHVERYLPIVAILLLTGMWHEYARRTDTLAMEAYQSLASPVTYDRTGTIVRIGMNSRDQLCLFRTDYPAHLQTLVLRKEDAWFHYHPGVQPYRIVRALVDRVVHDARGGASTITQQLARTILNTSGARTVENKLRETLLAFVLEYRHSKADLLTMYLNTIPLGGNVQGVPAAAHAYFDKQVDVLTESETLQLIAAFSRPNSARPLSEHNFMRAALLAEALATAPPMPQGDVSIKRPARLELNDLMRDCIDCSSSLDLNLNEHLRALLMRHLARTSAYGGTHGAIAVVSTQGELFALVGSPAPESDRDGMRINMALATRPIGSTVKPFLFLQGFMKGLRPYSLVEDRELKFDIGTGHALYPKNYDGTFQGTVTLEEALANSLNIPAVEVTRHNTLSDTYTFLGDTLGFKPPQEWASYAYGIPLGGLELDLLTLTHAFTLFANNGTLPLLVAGHTRSGTPFHFTPPHSSYVVPHTIAPPEYTALVHAILSDRTAGVEQFGVNGSLQLSHSGYGVKTGTSRNYHDSWTVGYTGDYAVGVWIGNAKNTPMQGMSGAVGAGTLWRDVMELMYTTPYYHATPIDEGPIVRVKNERGYSYGLPGDDVDAIRTHLTDSAALILSPHDGDMFLYTPGMRLPLTTSEEAVWTLQDAPFTPIRGGWYPEQPGTYTLTAQSDTQEEQVTVHITETPSMIP
ncbi:MAG: transglycosylase domain-containing protein [Candidatus Pacebacteria bacterium]|nr:transglycosylase domain-containing protein [Candidatus Paceibacterota bacterium]